MWERGIKIGILCVVEILKYQHWVSVSEDLFISLHDKIRFLNNLVLKQKRKWFSLRNSLHSWQLCAQIYWVVSLFHAEVFLSDYRPAHIQPTNMVLSSVLFLIWRALLVTSLDLVSREFARTNLTRQLVISGRGGGWSASWLLPVHSYQRYSIRHKAMLYKSKSLV